MSLGIAMCTYNGEKYLEEQLTSILSQTLKPDKIVICDDCSSDSTIDILKKFAARAPFEVEVVVNEKNLGSTKNFEKAIGLCDTEIIALSDQDDVWLPEKLRKIQAAFDANPECGYVFTDAQLVDENLQSLNRTMWDIIPFTSEKRTLFSQGHDKAILAKEYIVTGATMAFRGSNKELFLPILSCFVHDAWIALILTLADKRGVFVDEPLILYRQHAAQQIGSTGSKSLMTAEKVYDEIYAIEFICEEIRKAGLQNEFADELDYRYICELLRLLKKVYSNPEHYKSPQDVKEAEVFLTERFSGVSVRQVLSNRYLKFSYKLKAVRVKSGIYKWEKKLNCFCKKTAGVALLMMEGTISNERR